MARRKRRNAKIVSFKTRRGKTVRFKRTGRGHRRTSWNTAFGAASRGCRRKHHKPFTKAFGKCMKAALRGKKRRSR